MKEFIPLLKAWLLRRGGLEVSGKPKLDFSEDHTVNLYMGTYEGPAGRYHAQILQLYLTVWVHTDAPAKLRDYNEAISELVKEEILKPLGFVSEVDVMALPFYNSLLETSFHWEFDPRKDFVKDFVLDFAERLKWFLKKERILESTTTDEETSFVFEVLQKNRNAFWKPQYTRMKNLPPSAVAGLKKVHSAKVHSDSQAVSNNEVLTDSSSDNKVTESSSRNSNRESSSDNSNRESSSTGSLSTKSSFESFILSPTGITISILVSLATPLLLWFCYRQYKLRQESDSEGEEYDDEYENWWHDPREQEKMEQHQRQMEEMDRMARESSSREGSRANSSREGSERNHRTRN